MTGQRRLSELLYDAIDLYHDNFRLLITTAALVLAPFQLLQLSLMLLTDGDAASAPHPAHIVASFSATLRGMNPNTTGPLSWVYGLVWGPMLSGALIYAADRRYRGQTVTPADSIRAGWKRVLALLSAELIAGIVVVLAALPVACSFAVFQNMLFSNALNSIGNPGAQASPNLLMTISFVVVTIVLLIPALIINVRLGFAAQGIMLEQLGPIQGIDRSWLLTIDQSRRLLLFSVVLALITAIVVMLPAAVISTLVGALLGERQLSALISAALRTITACVTLPFSAAAYTLMFYDLRIRKEDVDREQQAGVQLPERGAPALE